MMWQGHLTLKNDSAAVQLHFLSGNLNLAKLSLPQPAEQRTPSLRIAQRMRLEQTQLEGVERRIQVWQSTLYNVITRSLYTVYIMLVPLHTHLRTHIHTYTRMMVSTASYWLSPVEGMPMTSGFRLMLSRITSSLTSFRSRPQESLTYK